MLRYSLEGGRLLARGDLAGLRPGPAWPWVRVLALQGFSPSLGLFSCDMGTETVALRCLSGLLWAFAETEPLVQVWRGGAGSRWGALLPLSLWGSVGGGEGFLVLPDTPLPSGIWPQLAYRDVAVEAGVLPGKSLRF